MTPLPLPTDNLYKFAALAGTALVGLSVIVPLSKLEELELRGVQTQTQMRVLEVEISALEEDLGRLEEGVKTLDASIDQAKASVPTLRQRSEQSRTELKETIERRQLIKVKQQELHGRSQENALLLRQMERTWSFLKVLGALGLAMATVGFYLWYRRVQAPADRAVREQSGAQKDA